MQLKHVILIAAAIAAGYIAGLLLLNAPAPDSPINRCPYEGAECPNAAHAMREYQIVLEVDSTIIYDGERRVGALPYDSTQALDKLMIFDNQ